MATYLLGTAASALVFGNAETLGLLLFSGALLSFFNLGAWGALYAYSPEQYPTSIRATGSGMAAAIGRVGGIFGPLLVGSLLAAGYGFGLIFGIFCGAIIIGVLAVVFLGNRNETIGVGMKLRITGCLNDSLCRALGFLCLSRVRATGATKRTTA